MKITIGENTYSLDMDAVSARDIVAIEAGLNVSFSRWMREQGVRLKDGDMSMMDAIAMVFLARRQSGEKTLKLDDVDFAFSEMLVDNEDTPPEPDSEPAPDATLDPSAGSPQTVSEPADEISLPSA
ncbi:MAG TPA: hypothetical protein VGL75_07300 [Acidothermaceae bacterium]|jgi:hypothetical protein